ncbi:MAG: glycosyltransferase [Candidatus Paceibacterota bacterium]
MGEVHGKDVLMKVMADFHHLGAARGQALLWRYRLGHDLWFPNVDFVAQAIQRGLCGEGTIMPCIPDWIKVHGGLPRECLDENGMWPYTASFEKVMDTDWDVFLCTRIETQAVFRKLKEIHPHGDKIKIVAMTGNDAVVFEWDWIHNLMACDYPTYMMAPNHVHKIYYSQELGTQFGEHYNAITPESLRVVSCYVNCWPNFTDPWRWDGGGYANFGRCPHCDSHPNPERFPIISPYGLWKEAEAMLPDREFREYGIGGKSGFVTERQLPQCYAESAVTVHMKTYDGFGYSMLQSISCGRPVIVPRRFYRYRTAGKYLIPGVTCFEVDWNAKELADAVRYITDNVERADSYGYACYRAARGIMNWEHEAFRVKEFLEGLI